MLQSIHTINQKGRKKKKHKHKRVTFNGQAWKGLQFQLLFAAAVVSDSYFITAPSSSYGQELATEKAEPIKLHKQHRVINNGDAMRLASRDTITYPEFVK
jgi:hypothetical protein